MEFFDVLRRRHSYRQAFLTDPVPREDLRAIVDAALLAPTGKNAQTTEFVIVDDAKSLGAIRSLHPMAAVQTAPAMIVCIVDEAPEAVYEGMSFAIEDCAAAVMSMLLACTALGYATVWIDGALRVQGRAEALADVLGLPAGKVPRVLLPVGRPAETGAQPVKKAFAERAWFGRYGAEERE